MDEVKYQCALHVGIAEQLVGLRPMPPIQGMSLIEGKMWSDLDGFIVTFGLLIA